MLAQVDEWLAFLPRLAAGPGLAEAAAALNDFLSLRTYLVGHRLTLADIALWGQLTGGSHSLQLGCTFYSMCIGGSLDAA